MKCCCSQQEVRAHAGVLVAVRRGLSLSEEDVVLEVRPLVLLLLSGRAELTSIRNSTCLCQRGSACGCSFTGSTMAGS